MSANFDTEATVRRTASVGDFDATCHERGGVFRLRWSVGEEICFREFTPAGSGASMYTSATTESLRKKPR